MFLPLTLAAINFHGPFVVISRNQYDVPYNQQQDYKEHLKRNGILDKAVLVENDELTVDSVNRAIAEVDRQILNEHHQT